MILEGSEAFVILLADSLHQTAELNFMRNKNQMHRSKNSKCDEAYGLLGLAFKAELTNQGEQWTITLVIVFYSSTNFSPFHRQS